ncbi:MAG: putative membrane protein [Lentimonas sp.]|jgi:putative membrane protein
MAILDPNSKKTLNAIKILSIVIPLAVAALFKVRIPGLDFSFLPPIYATMNGITAIFLLIAIWAIKNKKRDLHRRFIRLAMLCSILFLLMYVAYHVSSDPTPYGGDYQATYYTLLISHIILSVVVIPLVCYSYLFAWQGNFEKHKKWTRFSFPIWLYVAVTGVVVYLMISPYYV